METEHEPNDLSLNHLREQIKKIMIPLMIKIFELKLAAQQSRTPPSRLQKKSQESEEKVRQQLTSLSENLKLLNLWGQSCQNQILKALKELEAPAETPFRRTTSSDSKPSPAVEKSFTEAIHSQAHRFNQPPAPVKEVVRLSWWRKWFS